MCTLMAVFLFLHDPILPLQHGDPSQSSCCSSLGLLGLSTQLSDVRFQSLVCFSVFLPQNSLWVIYSPLIWSHLKKYRKTGRPGESIWRSSI